MADLDHLLKSYDVRDALDDIASADPPAYLRRCFAEALSTPSLTLNLMQQLGVCAMVLDAILNGREYGKLEPELIADWHMHYLSKCISMRDTATAALNRARAQLLSTDADAAAELGELAQRIAGSG